MDIYDSVLSKSDKKVEKLTSQLTTAAEDLIQLAYELKVKYIEEDYVDELMQNIISVKDSIIKDVAALKKEVL